ncbi:MAG: type VI secretion system contractile sheath large subunit [Candidatus Electrothrix aestuarii]|uniref:Type VI secretion system contractile sheath large subunit n=1 Tax=Candidatus Electrothrix aestuarii TaxID=3062594 RepID=A0AAU8LUV2_9BACT|nr:type VI secretion system contractile sheath large subunit [Candidatus Electrothrix aestuarii]WPD22010.1 MAG: type VI secretion system contractile sheath large subunit [Candidatus Electrothrix sp. GW3-3]
MSEKQQETAQEGAVQEGESISLLDEIVRETKLSPGDDGYDVTRLGLQTFIDALLQPDRAEHRVSQGLVDEMIADLDDKLSRQMNSILHNKEFQQLESAWRSLKYLVDHTDFRENTKIEVLNVSKQDLIDDFEDSPEIVKSGLYKLAYTAEYGQFGGQPYGMMVGNFDFGPGNQDMALLRNIASIASMSHAPFTAAAGPSFFGLDDFSGLPNLKDLKSIFDGPQYAKWRSLRQSEDSRNVGLALPRFLLRLPYGSDNIPVKSFHYNEDVSDGDHHFLWGNAAFAFTARVTDSFAKYRWCANIIGPQGGGAVEDLPLYQFEAMGELQNKIPTQIEISDRREFELAEEGFMSLTMRKGSDNAAFFSANSIQQPKIFPNTEEGKQAELNYKLGTQLPYTFVVSRIAHYLKVLQRENIGTWKERGELEDELNNWIKQYVSDQENPGSGVRSRRPLRKAKIEVSDVAGEPGWYRVGMQLQPHFKYMGASFTLSLVGKLDKS